MNPIRTQAGLFSITCRSMPQAPGAPNLGKKKWKDQGEKRRSRLEGMAILPPDKPQGWPASSYERATMSYLRRKGPDRQHILTDRWGLGHRI